jgi:hypothetical protein
MVTSEGVRRRRSYPRSDEQMEEQPEEEALAETRRSHGSDQMSLGTRTINPRFETKEAFLGSVVDAALRIIAHGRSSSIRLMDGD